LDPPAPSIPNDTTTGVLCKNCPTNSYSPYISPYIPVLKNQTTIGNSSLETCFVFYPQPYNGSSSGTSFICHEALMKALYKIVIATSEWSNVKQTASLIPTKMTSLQALPARQRVASSVSLGMVLK
jgi:hypothetical protein